MIKFVLADIHGVLTKGDERKLFIKYMEKLYGIDAAEHNKVWESNLDDLDAGKESVSRYMKRFNKRFGTRIGRREYYRAFSRNIVVNRKLMRGMRKLGLRVVIASDNFSGITDMLPDVLGMEFRKYRKFYSYRIGKIKRTGMLVYALKALKAKPQDCVLVDDSRKNIRIAKRLGMKTIFHRRNRETLRRLERLSMT